MERRKQRSRFHLKGTAGDLVDAAGDTEAVQFAGLQRFEDKQIEGTLEEISLTRAHGALSYRRPICSLLLSHIECQ